MYIVQVITTRLAYTARENSWQQNSMTEETMIVLNQARLGTRQLGVALLWVSVSICILGGAAAGQENPEPTTEEEPFSEGELRTHGRRSGAGRRASRR